jgi:GNAT superfamily N-acetyltransferase
MITVRQCRADDILLSPQFDALVAEYAAECLTDGVEHKAVNADLYRRYESLGMLTPFIAIDTNAGEMVGFISLMSHMMPHHSTVLATVESFFVASHARKGGAGVKLLRAAEKHAKELGASGLFVSAPVGSRLETMMPGVGYRATNTTFFKKFGHE